MFGTDNRIMEADADFLASVFFSFDSFLFRKNILSEADFPKGISSSQIS